MPQCHLTLTQTLPTLSLAMSGLEHNGAESTDAFVLKDSYGIVPRSVERLFAQMERERTASSDVSFSIYCSFIEVWSPDDLRLSHVATKTLGRALTPSFMRLNAYGARTRRSTTRRSTTSSRATRQQRHRQEPTLRRARSLAAERAVQPHTVQVGTAPRPRKRRRACRFVRSSMARSLSTASRRGTSRRAARCSRRSERYNVCAIHWLVSSSVARTVTERLAPLLLRALTSRSLGLDEPRSPRQPVQPAQQPRPLDLPSHAAQEPPRSRSRQQQQQPWQEPKPTRRCPSRRSGCASKSSLAALLCRLGVRASRSLVSGVFLPYSD